MNENEKHTVPKIGLGGGDMKTAIGILGKKENVYCLSGLCLETLKSHS